VLGCFGPTARGQQDCLNWVDRSDVNNANGPPTTSVAVYGIAAYDSRRGVTVLFGGNVGALTGQTWEFNGQFWRHASVVTGPADMVPGQRIAMTYDSRRFLCVLVGYGQVWEWDGESWTLRTDTPFPGGFIRGHDAVYDSARGVTVLFGGANDVGALSDQTWEFDGATWVERLPTIHPPATRDHRMAYDSGRGVVVLFNISGELWEYDGDDWVQRTSQLPPSPSARVDFGMDYDRARGVTVLQGGYVSDLGVLSDTWEWDGMNWTQRLPANPSNARTARYRHALVFDSARRRSLLLGGKYTSVNGVPQTAFLAELTAPNPPTPFGVPTGVAAVEGEPAQFLVFTVGGAPATFQWRHNGVPIPGATQQTLSIASVTPAAQGVYDAILGSGEYLPFTCPTAISNSGILTVLPAVPGDMDHDGDFDLDDLGMLLPGFTGPGQ
jgi:hypothetical protein